MSRFSFFIFLSSALTGQASALDIRGFCSQTLVAIKFILKPFMESGERALADTNKDQSLAVKRKVTYENARQLGTEWLAAFINQLDEAGASSEKDLLADFKNHTALEGILNRAFLNAIQHGGREGASQVSVVTNIYRDQNEIRFEIKNPQKKKFPPSLKRKFYPNEKVDIPFDEREGFRGHGIDHKYMFSYLKDLPPMSYMEWNANGREVTFSLSIRLRDVPQ